MTWLQISAWIKEYWVNILAVIHLIHRFLNRKEINNGLKLGYSLWECFMCISAAEKPFEGDKEYIVRIME